MKNVIVFAALSFASLAVCAAEVSPYDILEAARSNADCKAYADAVVAVTPHNDVYLNGSVARARATRECRAVVAARDTAVRTATKD